MFLPQTIEKSLQCKLGGRIVDETRYSLFTCANIGLDTNCDFLLFKVQLLIKPTAEKRYINSLSIFFFYSTFITVN